MVKNSTKGFSNDDVLNEAIAQKQQPKLKPIVVIKPPVVAPPVVVPPMVEPPIVEPPRNTVLTNTQNTDTDMTMFKNTIVGKLINKGVSAGKTIANVVTSPNPIQAASAALSGGMAQSKKEAVNETKDVQTASKNRSISNTSTEGGWMDKIKANKTVLGITFPLWIWIAIVVVILFLLWRFVFKRKSGGVRRSGARRGSSAMRARMARVRAARRRKK